MSDDDREESWKVYKAAFDAALIWRDSLAFRLDAPEDEDITPGALLTDLEAIEHGQQAVADEITSLLDPDPLTMRSFLRRVQNSLFLGRLKLLGDAKLQVNLEQLRRGLEASRVVAIQRIVKCRELHIQLLRANRGMDSSMHVPESSR